MKITGCLRAFHIILRQDDSKNLGVPVPDSCRRKMDMWNLYRRNIARCYSEENVATTLGAEIAEIMSYPEVKMISYPRNH